MAVCLEGVKTIRAEEKQSAIYFEYTYHLPYAGPVVGHVLDNLMREHQIKGFVGERKGLSR
jgi:hypothetical protein